MERDLEEPKRSVADHRLLSREYTGVGRNYTVDERMFALSVYAETGSVTEAAHTCSIPASTINNWLTRNEDIDQVLDSLRVSLRMGTAALYAQGAILAAQCVIERLQLGDEILDRDNNLIRRKVSGRDASAIASIFTDKHALLTQQIQKENNVDKGLLELSGRLVSILRAQGVTVSKDALTGPETSETEQTSGDEEG